ncbi:chemotaxis-specific protein-glutamate methyltransferase CheB, partial [Rhodothermus sp. AH-315-K08]|nr:chemotaxis-specific protein-glutamate methyltransferase CheB [Rhodothermus sp. AH-315-K08]
MFSALTQRGATITLDALDAGANDYVTKPLNARNRQESVAQIRRDLVPRIKALCARKQRLSGPPRRNARRPIAAGARIRDKVDVVAIGISTGGPSALAKLMPKLPRDLAVPIVLVQHMPPIFTASLATRLNDISPVAVAEAKDGDILRPGNAYLAAGGRHMVLQKTGTLVGIETNMEPPERGCRPAVDVLFRSVASIFGAGTLGVIMTGMGQDGLIGCEHICAAGGQIIVQDESSSVVWGMPGAVAKAGFAEEVLPLNQIGLEIARRVRRNRNTSPSKRPRKLSAGSRPEHRVHM